MTGRRRDLHLIPREVGSREALEWQARAVCASGEHDPDTWFPGELDRIAQWQAITLCNACPVRQKCLEYADATLRVDGIWGGKTEVQRTLARRAQKARQKRRDAS